MCWSGAFTRFSGSGHSGRQSGRCTAARGATVSCHSRNGGDVVSLALTPSPDSGASMQATPFLYFKGNCESALQFYEACGLGKIVELRRSEGTPLAERDGPSWNQKILFSRFEG